MRSSIAVATLAAATLVQAVDHLVQVGANNGLVFSPTSVTAAAGDTVSFQFQGKNHSVTQSTFAAPCTQMTTPTTGVDSGFMFVPPGSTQLPQFTINVNDASTPAWFFCAQTNPVSHCEMGMVFAINPTADKTFQAFQQAAMALNTTGGATPATGAPATGAPATGAPATGAPATGGSALGTPGSVSVTAGVGAASGTPSTTATGANTTTTHSGAVSMMRSVEFGGFLTGVVTAAAMIFSFAL